MSKYLVIVESPAKAKTIKKILGKDYLVMASYGHIMDLPSNGLNVDLTDFSAFYAPISGKEKHIENITKAADKASRIFLCPDSDREGEFIAESLANVIGADASKLARCTFNEITPKAIKNAIANPRKIDENLVNSQQARRILDRIVGYKLTNILWEKILRGLSGGRVQSVAVRILAEREREIQAFVPEEYWTIKGVFKTGPHDFVAELRELDGKKVVSSAKELESRKNKVHLESQKTADAAVKECAWKGKVSREYEVLAYKKTNTSDRPPPPFSTSTLQQAASGRLGFDASRTMRVAQRLYEGIEVRGEQRGLITYMRTDSFNVSDDARYAAKDFIEREYGCNYYPDKPNFYASKKGAQQAHECVRPTYLDLPPGAVKSALSSEQYKLYELIWGRFLASQMTPAQYASSTCDLGSDNKVTFRATGRMKTFDGWTRVYPVDSKDTVLPDIAEGAKVEISKALPEQHFTQPLPRYNDASLVKKMEEEGIGRPSTYASIIKVIQDRGYATKDGGGGRAPLRATDLGMIVTESLVGHFKMMDIGFTRDMESQLDDVEEGKIDYKKLLSSLWKDFEAELKAAKKNMKSTKEGKPSKHQCPKCENIMMERLSRHGLFFKCEKCEYIMDSNDSGTPQEKKDNDPTGIKCDLCGGDVILSKGRFGPYLCCVNYAKKVDAKAGGKKKKVPECSFTMSISKKNEPKRKLTPIETDIPCSKCGRKMIIRVASRKKVPSPFIGCSGFPKCRQVMDLPDSLEKEGEQIMSTFRELQSRDKKDLKTLQDFLREHGLDLQ